MKTQLSNSERFENNEFETLQNEEMNKVEGGADLYVRIENGKVVIIIK